MRRVGRVRGGHRRRGPRNLLRRIRRIGRSRISEIVRRSRISEKCWSLATPCTHGKPRGRRIEDAYGDVPPLLSFEDAFTVAELPWRSAF